MLMSIDVGHMERLREILVPKERHLLTGPSLTQMADYQQFRNVIQT